MRVKMVSLLLVLVLLVSGCSQTFEERYEEGEHLLRTRDYEGAIEIFEALLVEDDLNFDVWHDLVKALVRDEQLTKASVSLEGYYEKVKEDFDQNDALNYPNLLKDVMGYGYDIRSAGGTVGAWLDTLQPPMVNLENIAYELEMGDLIEIDVPEGMKVYWTLDGSDPDTKDDSQLYTEPLVANFEGEATLTVVAANDFGLEGPVNYTWLGVYKSPDALIPSLEAGAYEGPIVVFFPDYDYDSMDLYYTTDGSDPIDYGFYYEDTGIRLVGDEYTLRAVYYDYNTGGYSKETLVQYEVNNPFAVSEYTEITMVLFALDDMVVSEIDYAVEELNNMGEDYYIYSYQVDSYEALLDELSYGDVDVIYGSASYVEDFMVDDLIVPVNKLMTVAPETYLNDAMEAGLYDGEYYNLPVTINPNMMLYYNTLDAGDAYYAEIDTWDQLVDFANNGLAANNFLYPEDVIGEWLFGYYLGFGGSIQAIEGGFALDEQVMAEAMAFAYDLPTTYGLGFEGMDYVIYGEAIESGSASLVFADVAEINQYDYNYNYLPAGPMPMPKGGYSGAVNLVDGLMLTSASMGDTNKENLLKLLYDGLAKQTYVNYIAGYGESIPADPLVVDVDSLWLNGDYEDYEHAVTNNVTIPYTYDLIDLFDFMTAEMQEVLYNGADSEEAAKKVVEAFDGIE